MSEPVTPSNKVPLKANVFDIVRNANAQLLPMFPYMGPGDIVPCTAGFESDGSGMNIGYFLHENVVDEIVLSIASNGRMRTGDVVVGPKEHGVGGEAAEPYYAVQVITQRQLESGEQKEAMSLQCEKCSTVTLRYEYDDSEGNPSGAARLPGLPTIFGSAKMAFIYNSSEEQRTCKSCGHVNAPFPLDIWGWGGYAFRSHIVEQASADLAAVGK